MKTSTDLNKIKIWTNESISVKVELKAALKQKYDAGLEALQACGFLNYSLSTKVLEEGNICFDYGYVLKPSPKLIQWQILNAQIQFLAKPSENDLAEMILNL